MRIHEGTTTASQSQNKSGSCSAENNFEMCIQCITILQFHVSCRFESGLIVTGKQCQSNMSNATKVNKIDKLDNSVNNTQATRNASRHRFQMPKKMQVREHPTLTRRNCGRRAHTPAPPSPLPVKPKGGCTSTVENHSHP